jgi:hypothetical protein
MTMTFGLALLPTKDCGTTTADVGLIVGDLGIAARQGQQMSSLPTANLRMPISKGAIVKQRGQSMPSTACLHPLLLWLVGLQEQGGNDNNYVNPRGKNNKDTTISFLIGCGGQWSWWQQQ